jgi:Nitroreductase family
MANFLHANFKELAMSAFMNGTSHEALMELLQSAIQAPSSHNTQPWVFKLYDDAVDLYADRTRALPVNDPDDRELTISCGCALFNLRIAAAASGYIAHVTLLPDWSKPDLLARIAISPAALPIEDGLLEAFISQRRTYRACFTEEVVADEVKKQLRQAAFTEQCDFQILESAQARYAATDLISEGDAVQWANSSWRRELASWMHSRRRGDGITTSALATPITQLVVRSFDMGNGVAAKDRELANGSPILAILSSPGDSPKHWLTAGQALQRVLLVAMQQGLQASYLNQAIQIPNLRSKLQHLLHQPNFPQVVLRLGYPLNTQAASPRRPLRDVIDDQ